MGFGFNAVDCLDVVQFLLFAAEIDCLLCHFKLHLRIYILSTVLFYHGLYHCLWFKYVVKISDGINFAEYLCKVVNQLLVIGI